VVDVIGIGAITNVPKTKTLNNKNDSTLFILSSVLNRGSLPFALLNHAIIAGELA